MPTYKHITTVAQGVLNAASDAVDKKIGAVSKKVERLQKDLDTAKKAKLGASAIQGIKEHMKEHKILLAYLHEQGVSDAVSAQLSKWEKGHAKTNTVLIDAIDALIAKGMNKTVYQELATLKNDFSQFEKMTSAQDKKIEKSNAKTPAGLLKKIVALDQAVRQHEFFEQTRDRVLQVKVLSKDNIPPSNDYPMVRIRQKLANNCVKTSREELSGAHGFVGDDDGFGMFSMYVFDAFNHYKLGVELLGGDPKKIEDASYMDTASREGIDKDVWEFASSTIYDKTIFGPKALKEHRQKVLEQNARKLNNCLSKEVGDITSKSSGPSRKM